MSFIGQLFRPRSVLSVIIPVFNAEEYLRPCLQSVLRQITQNMEVIIIDDASSDSSHEIIQEFAKETPCIRVLRNKENLGPGPSRNLGLDAASGSYVAFVDADDTVNEHYFQKLLHSAIKQNSEIAFSDVHPQITKHKKFWDKYAISKNNIEELPVDGLSAAWGKLYARGFLKKHRVRFLDDKVIVGEDIPFTWATYLSAKNISFSPESIYQYRMHAAGADSIADDRLIGIFQALADVQEINKRLDPLCHAEAMFIGMFVSNAIYNYSKLQRLKNLDVATIDKYVSRGKSIATFTNDEVRSNPYINSKEKDIFLTVFS